MLLVLEENELGESHGVGRRATHVHIAMITVAPGPGKEVGLNTRLSWTLQGSPLVMDGGENEE